VSRNDHSAQMQLSVTAQTLYCAVPTQS